MKITIEFSTELVNKIVDGIMSNFPEASQGSVLECHGWNYKERLFGFNDAESGEQYNLNEARLHRAFELMFTDKWPASCTKVPLSTDWETWDDFLCQSDAIDFDAFAQLACLGEVIYG